ncbi:MAG: pectin esterase [Prevotella sp.]|nr:pectin esterase [Prevotella sp.]
MNKLLTTLIALCSLCCCAAAATAANYDNPDTLVVARDGTGQFRTVTEAVEVCRAFMDYHKVIFIKKGTYKEKLIIPQWLQNIELCGEDRDQTVITYDDHANITMDGSFWPKELKDQLLAMGDRPKLGTFRSFTVRIDANNITLKNLTIENNAARLGQAVALHTQGDRLTFVNCRFLGHQDTVYTGMPGTRLYFSGCYIEGTTDFIFGPSTAWFEQCVIHCKANSYITAASTPKEIMYGYIFNNCTVTAAADVEKVYLGRPWRDYGYTLFMNCELPAQIRPEGWHHWQKEREQTARYMEYNNRGPGAATSQRVGWSRLLSKKEAQLITLENVFSLKSEWTPVAP